MRKTKIAVLAAVLTASLIGNTQSQDCTTDAMMICHEGGRESWPFPLWCDMWSPPGWGAAYTMSSYGYVPDCVGGASEGGNGCTSRPALCKWDRYAEACNLVGPNPLEGGEEETTQYNPMGNCNS